MAQINLGLTTSNSKALLRNTNNSIRDAVDCKRILDVMTAIKGVGNDYNAVAVAFDVVPANATTGQAAYDAVNSKYAYLVNVYNAAITFDKLQG